MTAHVLTGSHVIIRRYDMGSMTNGELENGEIVPSHYYQGLDATPRKGGGEEEEAIVIAAVIFSTE